MMNCLSISQYRGFSRPPTQLAQRGFSLIELMVAILMGLFLLTGLLGIVVSLSSSFKTQDNLTQTQDAQRFMLTVFNNTIHNGGYFVNPRSDTVKSALPPLPDADGIAFESGQFVTGISGAASDTLAVRYQTAVGDTMLNCLGDTNVSGGNKVWTNIFSVDETKHQLRCAVREGATLSDPVVLADNVSSIKILYGVDSDDTGGADTYMTATQVAASSGAWLKVKSVKMAITMRNTVSPTDGADLPNPISHTITLMGKS